MSSLVLSWVIIILLVLLFFLPYALPGNTYMTLGAYAALSAVPVGIAAYLQRRAGGIVATLLIFLGLAVVNCHDVGFIWSTNLIRTWLLGGCGLFVFGLVSGQLCHTARQLRIAHAKAQQAEELMARAYEQQVSLNTLKDQFILNVNHELRTPLTQIYGYLELLKNYHETLENETRTRFIDHAANGCEELLSLINTLLDTARIDQHFQPSKRERLAVNQIACEIIEQFDPRQRREHPIHLHIDEDVEVQGDPQYLRQVLRNLISNAIKYSPAHSPIEIYTTHSSHSPEEPAGKAQTCICVQDAGPGIPPEDLPLLFGKFVRLKRDVGGPIRGTGLGLYISKHMIESMGGKIWVESSGVPGEGSCFYFTLPAVEQAVQSEVKVMRS